MKMFDVALGSGEEVIHAKDFMSIRQQAVNKVRAEKPSSPGY